MFVKNVQHEGKQHAEQVINQSMGVRRPPSRTIKERSVEETKVDIVGKSRSAHEKPPAKSVRAKIDDSKAKTIAQDKNIPTNNPINNTTNNPVNNPTNRPMAAQANDKLESIKITAPGTYELNLPSLFERDELIMAVKEGTYFIDLSSAFRKGKKE